MPPGINATVWNVFRSMRFGYVTLPCTWVKISMTDVIRCAVGGGGRSVSLMQGATFQNTARMTNSKNCKVLLDFVILAGKFDESAFPPSCDLETKILVLEINRVRFAKVFLSVSRPLPKSWSCSQDLQGLGSV